MGCWASQISEKKSWDTKQQCCYLLLARLLTIPWLCFTEERLETDQVRLCKWILKFSPSSFLALKCVQIALKLRDNIRFQVKLQDFLLKAKQTHKDYLPPKIKKLREKETKKKYNNPSDHMLAKQF